MTQLAIIGHTTRDRVDGGASRAGGAPLHALRALHEVNSTARVVTKVAEADAALLAPIAELADNLVWLPASETATFALEHDDAGNRRVIVEALGDSWEPADLKSWVLPAIQGCRIAHLGALSAADFPADTVALLNQTHRLSLEGQGLVRPGRRGPVAHAPPASLDLLRHVEILKLSLEEATVLGLEPTQSSLQQLGVPELVLTDGEHGAWILAEGRLIKIVADSIPVRDVTGAGDGFIACYLAARLDDARPEDAGRFAAGAVATMLRHRQAEVEPGG